MKGRPITDKEFEKLLEAVPKIARIPAAIESLRHLLRGLWLSGLRLGEALSLTWDQWSDGIRVEIDSDNDVCLMIDGENQKNRQALTYPVVDDFANFLLSTPECDRHGFVFNPMGRMQSQSVQTSRYGLDLDRGDRKGSRSQSRRKGRL